MHAVSTTSLHGFADATINFHRSSGGGTWAEVGSDYVRVVLWGTPDEIAATLRRLADDVERQAADARFADEATDIDAVIA